MAALTDLERRVAILVMVYDASDYRLRRLVARPSERRHMSVWRVADRQREVIAEALERADKVLEYHGLTADHVRRAAALPDAAWDDTPYDRATTCAVCGAHLPRRHGPGRPRVYCRPACRQRAHLERSSRR